MSALAHQANALSVAEYLAGERASEQKYEYVDGRVYAMAGASANHIKTAAQRFRYPDLMVVCNDDPSQDPYVRETPLLIVEVLSGSTHPEKRAEYLALPSLLEYVLIEQDIAEVVVQRRSEGWRSSYHYPRSTVTLESIGLTLAVEAIYERVENADMRAFLAEQP